MEIQYLNKKTLRKLKLSWKEAEQMLEAMEAEEGMQLEHIASKTPLAAFQEGMETVASGHDPETDTWTIVTGFKKNQVLVARASAEYLTDEFKHYIKEGYELVDEK